MLSARFKLSSVTIEGFKAFTNPQTIDFSERHGFIFGDNGLGKSSIVEAIRWCLLGLRDRPDTEVRNLFHAAGESRVELKLQATDGVWTLERRLRPGAERSRLSILDPEGRDTPQSQVFPLLARMGPREGTHIIYAAQQGSARRPQADISDFDKVLYHYLNLQDVPELLDRIDRLLEEQETVQEEVAADINEIEGDLRDSMARATAQLDELSRNPPWRGGELPTGEESMAKVDNLMTELASLTSESVPADQQPFRKLDTAEQWIAQATELTKADLGQRLQELQEKAAKLRTAWSEFREASEQSDATGKTVEQTQVALQDLLGESTLAEISSELAFVSSQVSDAGAKLAIQQEAYDYLTSHAEQACIVCQAEHDVEELRRVVSNSIESAAPEHADQVAKLERLKALHSRAAEVDASLTSLKARLAAQEEAESTAKANVLSTIDLPDASELNERAYEANLSTLLQSQQTIEAQLQGEETTGGQWRRRIDDVRRELRFHELRDECELLQARLTSGLQPCRDRLAELTEMANTVHAIKEVIEQSLSEALDKALPQLSSMMTEVFIRLTKQRSFDRVIVRRTNTDGKPALEVRVGSTRKPETLSDPEDVLNAQANSALRLVPYFVFSKFQAEAIELDLLLIDDPSQSFDTSHVGLLFEELVYAAGHAQLIVATHEEEKFAPEVAKHFEQSECGVMRVVDFSPDEGPAVVHEH